MGNFSVEQARQNALRAISPISRPISKSFSGKKLGAFKCIPHHEYYLIFLMLVDLLDFHYWGPGEKVAYIIPVEYDGKPHSIVYGKFGMSIEFGEGGDGAAVYKALRKGMRATKPYYLWRAEQASNTSNLNLLSKCPKLWEKYEYLKSQSIDLMGKFEDNKEIFVTENGYDDEGKFRWSTTTWPAYEYKRQSIWLHEAAVDAFFAWCEQSLVHIAVLMGRLTNGREIAQLLHQEFGEKCRLVFDLNYPPDKAVYDNILKLRIELRNYIAHGSFGKDGSTFQFHSKVGAVPLNIVDSGTSSSFSFSESVSRDWEHDYERIDRFVEQLWSGVRLPAKQYVESGLPCVLTYATDGIYQRAMQSEEEMSQLIEYLSMRMDNAANMDF